MFEGVVWLSKLEIDRYIGLPIFFPIFKHFTIIRYRFWKKKTTVFLFFLNSHIHNYTEYNQQWNVFLCICTHTWSSGHTHTHTHLEQWTHTHTHTPGAVDTHTHTHLEQWTHTHTHTPGAVDTHTWSSGHTHTHTWSSGHTHTHTHTHLEQWTHTHLEQWTHTHTHTHLEQWTHTHLEQWTLFTTTACNFIQDSLVWNTLNYINSYYRTIISPINI